MPGFLEELHRRSLFRTAAGYVVVAWVLIQVADIILPTFSAPTWVLQVLILFVALGFPLTLLLAWIYGGPPDDAENGATRLTQSGLITDGVLVGVIVALIGVTTFGLFQRPQVIEVEAAPTVTGASIAVLAFRDLSQDQDQVHFAEGISEEILNALAQVPDLHVAARTSSFSFSGDAVTAQEIGQALNVAYVLEGSVRISGNNMRITAQLIDSETGFHLWSNNFNRQMEDIFVIQEDVANQILTALNEEMGTSYRTLESDQGTESVEAYSAYLLGRYHMAKRQAEPMRLAESAFQQAIEIDPGYADAHAALGRAYYLNYEAFDEDEVAQDMREHLYEAINLDPDNAVALATLSLILGLGEWRFVEAGILARRAFELAPNDIEIKMSYVNFLLITGRFRDGYFLIQEILEEDPSFPPALGNLQNISVALQNYEQALQAIIAFREMIDDEDTINLVGVTIYASILAQAMGDEALLERLDAELDEIIDGDDLMGAGVRTWRAGQAAYKGDLGPLQAAIDNGDLEYFYENFDQFDESDMGLVYTWVGDMETAVDYFNQSIDNRDLGLLDVQYSPFPYPQDMFERPEIIELLERPDIRTLVRMRAVAREQGQLEPLTPEELGELTN